jgi:replicative DNA helicase
MTDFKESGAVEYSADVLMGLEFASAGSKDYSEKAEKRKDPREIRLVVLKNRNGKAWEAANFKYHSFFNYYEEAGSGFIELPEDAEDPFKDMRGSRRK